MSKVMVMSDLHLGHKNICKYRPQFSSEQEHSEIVFDNLASGVGKRDVLYLLGDVAFSKEWLERIKEIRCLNKILVVGNHDLEFGIHMRDLVEVYDSIYSLWSKGGYWFSHCPIHPNEIRRRDGCIHGHTHGNSGIQDPRYFDACVENTDFKPISLIEIKERMYYEKQLITN